MFVIFTHFVGGQISYVWHEIQQQKSCDFCCATNVERQKSDVCNPL